MVCPGGKCSDGSSGEAVHWPFSDWQYSCSQLVSVDFFASAESLCTALIFGSGVVSTVWALSLSRWKRNSIIAAMAYTRLRKELGSGPLLSLPRRYLVTATS